MSKTSAIPSATQINNDLITYQRGEIWQNSVTGNFWFRVETGPGTDVYVDLPISSSGGLTIVGSVNGGDQYPAASAGDAFLVASNGNIGDPNGPPINIGELVVATVDTPGGDFATVGDDYVIVAVDVIDATELAAGISRFSTMAELAAGIADNLGISPLNLTDLLTITGLAVPMKAVSFTGQTEADPAIVGTPDRTVAGANGASSGDQAGKGGDDAVAGGIGGASGSGAGDGGDTTGVGGVGGDGGESGVSGGDGGSDLDGTAGQGGKGGDSILKPGNGGVGFVDGRRGFARLEGITKSYSETGIVALAGGGYNAVVGAQLSHTYNKVDVVAAPLDSVTFPPAEADGANEAGMDMYVFNSGANNLNVFPFLGDKFENAAVDIPTVVAPGAFLKVHCFANGEWFFA